MRSLFYHISIQPPVFSKKNVPIDGESAIILRSENAGAELKANASCLPCVGPWFLGDWENHQL
jgi:hypothetical protein